MKYHLLIISIIFAAIAFASVALAQTCRDGCTIGTLNTFQGDYTLGVATGAENSAFGFAVLSDCQDAFYNTAVGSEALGQPRFVRPSNSQPKTQFRKEQQ